MFMRMWADAVEAMEEKAMEYDDEGKTLKGYGLAALSGLIDGSLNACTYLGIAMLITMIETMISNKKNDD